MTLKPNLYVSLFLIFLTFVTYVNILPNKLFFDDEELIYKNAYVADLKYFPKYFTTNMIAGAGKESNMYRPLLIASFAIDHFFWADNPAGYHFTSIILHTLNSILLFTLIFLLFGNKLIAFLTSVLFIIHPANSEAVIYASGRTDPLYTFFSLCGFVIFTSLQQSRKFRLAKYILTMFFFIFALLSKESAIVYPFILLLIFFVKNKFRKIEVLKALIYSWPIFIFAGFYLLLRLTVLQFGNTLNFYISPNLYSQNLPVRLYTFTKVFFGYFNLILFPKDLLIARNPDIILSPLNLWVLFFLIFNISIFYWAFRQKRTKQILPVFAILWFYICILPSSGIIPINNLEAEHYLYLPGISIFLLISYIFYGLWIKFREKSQRIIILLSLFLLISLLIIRTTRRTFDFRDPITFYNISLAQTPSNIPMRNNLAMAYAENGQIDKAINQYQFIIASTDVYPNVHHNLGNAYKELRKYQEAEQEYFKALKMDPNFYFSFYALADLYQKTNEIEKYRQILNKLNIIQKP